MKKFLSITLALALAATGAWAVIGKVDTATKAKKPTAAIEKTFNIAKAMHAMAKAPANAVTVPYYNTFDTDDEIGQISLYDANQDGST